MKQGQMRVCRVVCGVVVTFVAHTFLFSMDSQHVDPRQSWFVGEQGRRPLVEGWLEELSLCTERDDSLYGEDHEDGPPSVADTLQPCRSSWDLDHHQPWNCGREFIAAVNGNDFSTVVKIVRQMNWTDSEASGDVLAEVRQGNSICGFYALQREICSFFAYIEHSAEWSDSVIADKFKRIIRHMVHCLACIQTDALLCNARNGGDTLFHCISYNNPYVMKYQSIKRKILYNLIRSPSAARKFREMVRKWEMGPVDERITGLRNLVSVTQPPAKGYLQSSWMDLYKIDDRDYNCPKGNLGFCLNESCAHSGDDVNPYVVDVSASGNRLGAWKEDHYKKVYEEVLRVLLSKGVWPFLDSLEDISASLLRKACQIVSDVGSTGTTPSLTPRSNPQGLSSNWATPRQSPTLVPADVVLPMSVMNQQEEAE